VYSGQVAAQASESGAAVAVVRWLQSV